MKEAIIHCARTDTIRIMPQNLLVAVNHHGYWRLEIDKAVPYMPAVALFKRYHQILSCCSGSVMARVLNDALCCQLTIDKSSVPVFSYGKFNKEGIKKYVQDNIVPVGYQDIFSCNYDADIDAVRFWVNHKLYVPIKVKRTRHHVSTKAWTKRG